MKRDKVINRALSIFFTILSLAWIYPVFMIALNSFKKATAISTTTAFDLLTPETFNGLANYVHALNEQGFASAFMYSLIITVTSVVLILVCCSMCAWYVVRVNSKISNFFYYLFVFSMVVPFQMLMFTLSNLADRIGFNTPFNICFIYLGFGAGLAVFMFAGFVKNIPLEIEEAAMIDGCNNRARKIQQFLSQSFHVAEKFTGNPGVYVRVEDTVRSFAEIVDGKADDLPEQAFRYASTIEDVRERARKMGEK